MSPLLPYYAKQMNVPICTGVTVLTLDSGEVVIPEFVKGLWFENRMKKLLIKPNQCQKFGIQIYDDPNDPHRNLGIEASEDLLIPMIMQGSTCGIITHHTTDNELHECQRVIL